MAHKKLYTYHHDDGPLFPTPKKLLPKVTATRVAQYVAAAGTFQQHGYDKALAALLSVFLIVGGYFLSTHYQFSDILRGAETFRESYTVSLIDGLQVPERGTANAYALKENLDNAAVRWYELVCRTLPVCRDGVQ